MNRYLFCVWLLFGVTVFTVHLPGCRKEAGPAPGTSAEHAGHDEHSPTHVEADPSDMLMLTAQPTKPRSGEPVALQLMLHDASGKMLTSFEPVHEKLAHLIIIRAGLNEFAHLHPSIDAVGNMTASHTFPGAGTYHVFLDYKSVGKPARTARTEIVVEGEAKLAAPLTPSVPGLLSGDGLQADVSLRSGEDKTPILSFRLQDSAGKPILDLQPYLGAMGHLVVISADASNYVHAHPLASKTADNIVEFEVHFPAPGVYKAWGQFQRAGQVSTISAVIKFEGTAAHH